jgi:hypothetical protein
MRLALGPGNGDEIGLGKLPGLSKHWSRHGDIVVMRETPHRFGRRGGERRQSVRQFSAGFDLRTGDQATEYQIENTEMVVVETTRAVEKKRCNTPERRRPSLRRSVPDHLLQFREKRSVGGHPQLPMDDMDNGADGAAMPRN